MRETSKVMPGALGAGLLVAWLSCVGSEGPESANEADDQGTHALQSSNVLQEEHASRGEPSGWKKILRSPLERLVQRPMTHGGFDRIKASDGHLFVVGHAEAADLGDGVTWDTPTGFLAKLDENGRVIWLRRFASTATGLALGPDGDIAISLVIQGELQYEDTVIGQSTDSGNIVVRLDRRGYPKSLSSLFRETADVAFDPAGALFIVSGGRLVKSGRHGQVLWERALAEPLAQDVLMRPTGVVTDPRGNVVITAEYNGPFAIAGEPLPYNPWGTLLAEYDAHGAPVWHRTTLSTAGFRDAATDASADVVVIGRSYGPVDVGTGTLGADGVWTLFLAKYTRLGLPIFVKTWAARSWQGYERLDVDKHGHIGVVAFIDSPVDLGGGLLSLNGVGQSGEGSQLAAAIAKFTPCGHHLWSTLLDDGFGEAGGFLLSDAPGVSFGGHGELWVSHGFHENAQLGTRHLVASPSYGTDTVLLKFRP